MFFRLKFEQPAVRQGVLSSSKAMTKLLENKKERKVKLCHVFNAFTDSASLCTSVSKRSRRCFGVLLAEYR